MFTRLLAVTAIASLSGPAISVAQAIKPLPHPVGQPTYASTSARVTASAPSVARWTPLTHQPDFLLDGASSPILLTDGSVLVQDAGFPDWWKLTPDEHGSYVNGTWTQVASLPADYSPLYHASAVLPDGRLIIEGGEYLLNADQTDLIPSWTAKGAIYDPVRDAWQPVAPPPFFTGFGPFPQTIGDAQNVVLANGTYMQANCCKKEAALLDASTLTWTPTGTGKFDIYDEEGWTLLPDGKVLTFDAYVGAYDAAGMGSEIYDPKTGAWSPAGSTVVQLWDSAAACGGKDAASFEVGPAVLRADGTVFVTGANQCGPAHNAVYNTVTRKWSAAPDFPDELGIADGPASLEPNGKVLMMASPRVFETPATFLEWDGKALTNIPGPPNAVNDSSFFGNMLVLPTGQILLTDLSNDIEIYTPTVNRAEQDKQRPLIAFTPLVLSRGKSYELLGFGLNGVSQGASYGDDAASATNYPLVRITNLKTSHVFYARTHDHSYMGVARGHLASTHYDVSAAQESGPSKLEVVANGVASVPLIVLVL